MVLEKGSDPETGETAVEVDELYVSDGALSGLWSQTRDEIDTVSSYIHITSAVVLIRMGPV